MKVNISISVIFIIFIWGCNNKTNRLNSDISYKSDSLFQILLTNKYPTHNIIFEKYTDFLNKDSAFKANGYINIKVSDNKDTFFIKAPIVVKYLDSIVLNNRYPSYYGRNSKHLTIHLYSDTTILFSNDYVNYQKINLSDISTFIKEYYLDEKKQLKYSVDLKDKGIDIRCYYRINPEILEKVIFLLFQSYMNTSIIASNQTFNKQFKDLNSIEIDSLKKILLFRTELIVSKYQSIYTY